MVTQINNIPQELAQTSSWVCWVTGDKVPRDPHTGDNAKSNDPTTWGTFDEAITACKTYSFDGIGFMFAPPYFGIDLDHVMKNREMVDEFAHSLQSYTEISRSGDGIHIICKGKLPDGARRKNGVEMYQTGRYFIITGNLYTTEDGIQYKDVADGTEAIKPLHNKYMPSNQPAIAAAQPQQIRTTLEDDELIEKARACKTGDAFSLLFDGHWQGAYHSQSEADMALANHLAFWTGKDPDQMDRLFRASGLMRDKWDEDRGGMRYGDMTIQKAIDNCGEIYQPAPGGDDTSLAMALFGGSGSVINSTGKKYDRTDTGNAQRLADRFGSILHYNYNRKKWMYWDGKRWALDTTGEIKKLADLVCEDIKASAANEESEAEIKAQIKWAQHSASSNAKEAMIKETQHLGDIPITPEQLDTQEDYINVQNGIINLRNGELLPHDSAMMMSKIAGAEYDPSGKKPERWLQFLDEITNGDKDLQRYMQKAIGYSLSGSTAEQCAFFLYGLGNNGKSTLLETLSEALGDYAANTQPDTFMAKKSESNGANSDIARLKGARFVTSEEPTEGVRLNEGLLKQMTGGSRVTARHLYGDEFEFTPEFKVWLATNHKPIIRGTDAGIWRRIRMIPFEINIAKENVDKNLKYKLRAELPQILTWAVEGYILWQQEGLEPPAAVEKATNEYKAEMDIIEAFVESCIEIEYDPMNCISARELFELYKRWAKENNEYEMKSNKFFREIGKKLPEKGRNGSGVYYPNIKPTSYGREVGGYMFRAS